MTSPLMMRVSALAFCALVSLAPMAGASGEKPAPEFSLTLRDLRAMTAGLPKTVQDRIISKPGQFLHLLAKVLDEPADLLVLVDKTHPLPSSYVPPDLVKLAGGPLAVSRGDLELRGSIMAEVLDMNAAARSAGATLLFSSSYRSYDYQKSVYEREVRMYGQAAADRESARPGTSQHQLGTAIDFGSITDAFAATKAGRWLVAHAWEYGFSLSYPQGYEELTGYRWESWHYRYIARPAALMQKDYFDDVQQLLLVFLHDNRAALEAKRIAR